MKDKPNILTLAPKQPHASTTFAEANEVLEVAINKYHTMVTVGISKDNEYVVAYTPLTPAELFLYAEIIRKEALDLLYGVYDEPED